MYVISIFNINALIYLSLSMYIYIYIYIHTHTHMYIIWYHVISQDHAIRRRLSDVWVSRQPAGSAIIIIIVYIYMYYTLCVYIYICIWLSVIIIIIIIICSATRGAADQLLSGIGMYANIVYVYFMYLSIYLSTSLSLYIYIYIIHGVAIWLVQVRSHLCMSQGRALVAPWFARCAVSALSPLDTACLCGSWCQTMLLGPWVWVANFWVSIFMMMCDESYYTILYTIYYTILYYSILYYTIIYYTILYYTILFALCISGGLQQALQRSPPSTSSHKLSNRFHFVALFRPALECFDPLLAVGPAIRPVRLLRVWISEGWTQADS